MSLKLGIQHRALEFYPVCSNDDPTFTFDILRKGQLWFLMHLYGEMVDYSEIIDVCDIKVGIYS